MTNHNEMRESFQYSFVGLLLESGTLYEYAIRIGCDRQTHKQTKLVFLPHNQLTWLSLVTCVKVTCKFIDNNSLSTIHGT